MKKIKTFKGQVNDKVFDNQKAMNAYLEECQANGTEITTTSTSEEIRWVPEEDAQGKVTGSPQCGLGKGNGRGYGRVRGLHEAPEVHFERVPEPYRSVMEYLVPEYRENIYTGDRDINTDILRDSVTKLNRRLEYYNRNIEEMHRSGLAEQLVPELINKYKACAKRAEECDSQINNNNERIKRLQAEIDQLKTANEKAAALNAGLSDYGSYCEILRKGITGEE